MEHVARRGRQTGEGQPRSMVRALIWRAFADCGVFSVPGSNVLIRGDNNALLLLFSRQLVPFDSSIDFACISRAELASQAGGHYGNVAGGAGSALGWGIYYYWGD